MASWILAAAYECAAAHSMDPWAATKKALHYSVAVTPALFGSLPNDRLSRDLLRLDRELFTVPS